MFKKIPAVKTAVITIAVFVAVSSFFIIDLTVVNSYMIEIGRASCRERV